MFGAAARRAARVDLPAAILPHMRKSVVPLDGDMFSPWRNRVVFARLPEVSGTADSGSQVWRPMSRLPSQRVIHLQNPVNRRGGGIEVFRFGECSGCVPIALLLALLPTRPTRKDWRQPRAAPGQEQLLAGLF